MVYTPRSLLRRILPTNRTYQMSYIKNIRDLLEGEKGFFYRFFIVVAYIVGELLFVALLAWFFFVFLWFLQDK